MQFTVWDTSSRRASESSLNLFKLILAINSFTWFSFYLLYNTTFIKSFSFKLHCITYWSIWRSNKTRTSSIAHKLMEWGGDSPSSSRSTYIVSIAYPPWYLHCKATYDLNEDLVSWQLKAVIETCEIYVPVSPHLLLDITPCHRVHPSRFTVILPSLLWYVCTF